MTVEETIAHRRAYRSLDPVLDPERYIEPLMHAAQLSPSCFNHQPWHYICVYEPGRLEAMKSVLSDGNKWAHDASMIIAVCTKKEDDCVIYDREYYLFDTGLATAFLILRATDLGLVAHPIAGYSPRRTREVLGISDEYQVITLVIIGRHAKSLKPSLSEQQKKRESVRPERKPFSVFVHHNSFTTEESNG